MGDNPFFNGGEYIVELYKETGETFYINLASLIALARKAKL